MVQPGVRWFDLHDALEAAGGRCWPSIPDLGWGSVVGNTLEYGRGYTPYGDHATNVCGMEVVLPDGELLRTGMGGQTGNAAWHAYQHSYGPSLDRLFMQSNYGIVTQMGVWIMPRPEVYASCSGSWEGEDALAAVADTLRELMLEGIIRNSPVMGRGVGVFDDRRPGDRPDRSDVAAALRALRAPVDRRRALGHRPGGARRDSRRDGQLPAVRRHRQGRPAGPRRAWCSAASPR